MLAAQYSNPYAFYPLWYTLNTALWPSEKFEYVLTIRDNADTAWASFEANPNVLVYVSEEDNFLPSLFDVARELGDRWRTAYEKFFLEPPGWGVIVTDYFKNKVSMNRQSEPPPLLSADTLAIFEHAAPDRTSVPPLVRLGRGNWRKPYMTPLSVPREFLMQSIRA